MIDFIQVDKRYCWEPLCGTDTALYITTRGNVELRIVKNPEQFGAHVWIATLLIDCMGARVVVYFDDVLPAWVATRVVIRELDKEAKKYTLSCVTEIEGEDIENGD